MYHGHSCAIYGVVKMQRVYPIILFHLVVIPERHPVVLHALPKRSCLSSRIGSK